MEQNREENLKRLIREAGEENVPADFTQNILKSIQTELQYQTAGTSSLKSVLKEYAVEQPSLNFQAQIMVQLASAPAIEYKPIISAKTWYLVAATFAALLLVSYLYPSSKSWTMPQFFTYVSHAWGYLFKYSGLPNDTVEISTMTLIGLAILLLTDFFLRQKRHSYTKLARS